MMIRNELEDLLQARLQGRLTADEIAGLQRAILALEEDWEEFEISPADMGYGVSTGCSEICLLASQVDRGATFKIFRKKRR